MPYALVFNCLSSNLKLLPDVQFDLILSLDVVALWQLIVLAFEESRLHCVLVIKISLVCPQFVVIL